MSKILKFKRGTTAKNSTHVGSNGELTVDTDKKTIVVHDGITTGGSSLATEASVTNLSNTVNNKIDKNVSIVAGTATKITYDSKGLILFGLNPTTISGYGITDTYTKTEVDSKITALINAAPAALDTINELAAALGNDANFATTITNSLSNKANLSGATFTGGISATSVWSSGNVGFQNDVYYTNSRNPIWSFGNANTFGISYHQGTAGIGGVDSISIHPNGALTAAAASLSITPTEAYVVNQKVIHAGNIESVLGTLAEFTSILG